MIDDIWDLILVMFAASASVAFVVVVVTACVLTVVRERSKPTDRQVRIDDTK